MKRYQNFFEKGWFHEDPVFARLDEQFEAAPKMFQVPGGLRAFRRLHGKDRAFYALRGRALSFEEPLLRLGVRKGKGEPGAQLGGSGAGTPKGHELRGSGTSDRDRWAGWFFFSGIGANVPGSALEFWSPDPPARTRLCHCCGADLSRADHSPSPALSLRALMEESQWG